MSNLPQIFFVFVGLVAATTCRSQTGTTLSRFEKSEAHMGVLARIVLYAPDRENAEKGFEIAFGRIAELEDVLSSYRPNSEANRLANAPAGSRVKVSRDLWDILCQADQISRASDGSFDVTVGPFVKLWRKSRQTKQLPGTGELTAAAHRSGYHKIGFDPRTNEICLCAEAMQLDFGGIGKGYAADQAMVALRRTGNAIAMIDLGGDIVVGDSPPGKPAWRVAVAPLTAGDKPTQYIEISNRSVATSGDALQFIEISGQRYSHIIDPRTGVGVRRRSSVTVVANDGAAADAWASAFSVLGPERSLQMINWLATSGDRSRVEVHGLSVNDVGSIERFASPGFPALHSIDDGKKKD